MRVEVSGSHPHLPNVFLKKVGPIPTFLFAWYGERGDGERIRPPFGKAGALYFFAYIIFRVCLNRKV